MISFAIGLLDRLSGGRAEKLVRFGSVSVVGIVLTQSLILLLHGILDIDARVTNVLAVCISAGPVFVLNKRWVWGKDGPTRIRREVLPFWGFTLLGLFLSTILVAIVDGWTERTWPVMVANITGFGLVWVAKFAFLDAVVFRHHDEDAVAGRLL